MSTSGSILTRSDGTAISVISWAALIGGLSTLAGIVIGTWTILGAPDVTVSTAFTGASPVRLPAWSGDGLHAIASSAEITVEDAPFGVRAPLLGSMLAAALTPLSITTGIFLAGRQTARQHLRPALAMTTAVLAVITFASGLFAPFLRAMAATAALQLGPLGHDAPFAFQLDGAVLAIPSLLLVISALLYVSERLQKDTEGLV